MDTLSLSQNNEVTDAPVSPKPTGRQSKALRVARRLTGATLGALLGLYVAALIVSPQIEPPARPNITGRNGFPMLVVATRKAVHDIDVAQASDKAPEKQWTLAQKRELVAVNQTALAQTQEALRYPYQEEINADSFYAEMPHYTHFRQMNRLLTLAGDVAWEEGEQKKATGYYLDGVTMGRRIPHQVGIVGSLAGIACEYNARRPLWEHLDAMSEDTAVQVLGRLQKLRSERLPYAETMRTEKYIVLTGTKTAMEHPERFREYIGTQNNVDKMLAVYGKLVPHKYVIGTMGTYMDAIVSQVENPYIQDHQELEPPKEVYTRIMTPVYSQARCKYVANETGDNLLRTALALRIYHLRNGKYPDSLSELTTAGIIDAVPADPFASPGVPLQYKRQSDGTYLLYSIGPDGVNDMGKGIDSGFNNNSSRTARMESKGDMVAGWYGY